MNSDVNRDCRQSRHRGGRRLRLVVAMTLGTAVAPMVGLGAGGMTLFSAHEPISSAAVNANFLSLDERLSPLDEAFVVDESRNVGVGVADASARFSIEANQRRANEGEVALRLVDTRTAESGDLLNKMSLFDWSGEAAYVGWTHNAYFGSLYRALVFGVNGSEGMRITADGNVGIGTTTPSERIEAHSIEPTIKLVNDNPDNGSGHYLKLAQGYNSYLRSSDALYLDAGLERAREIALTISGETKLIVAPSGNVGIGTSLPLAKLDVNGGATIRGNLALNGGTLYLSEGGDYLRGDNGGGVVSAHARGNMNLEYNWNNIGGVLTISNNGGHAARFDSDGNLGIGTTTPQYTLDVSGQIRADNVQVTSDARLKRDILPLTNSIDLVSCLQGVSYSLIDPGAPQGRYIGLVAQEVEGCIPDVVSTDSAGYKSVSYGRLVAPLIEATKTQQEEIKMLSSQVQRQQTALDELRLRDDHMGALLIAQQRQIEAILSWVEGGAGPDAALLPAR